MAGEKNFGSSVLDFIDKVAESGKKGFRAAGDAISDFGDKSVIRIELGQLKSKLGKTYSDLGKNIYEKIDGQKLEQISLTDDLALSELVDSIRKIKADIKKHEDTLESIKKEKKSTEKSDSSSSDTQQENADDTVSIELK